jgi:hypothetical protein
MWTDFYDNGAGRLASLALSPAFIFRTVSLFTFPPVLLRLLLPDVSFFLTHLTLVLLPFDMFPLTLYLFLPQLDLTSVSQCYDDYSSHLLPLEVLRRKTS